MGLRLCHHVAPCRQSKAAALGALRGKRAEGWVGIEGTGSSFLMLREKGIVGSKCREQTRLDCWTHGDCPGPTRRASRTHTGSPVWEPLSLSQRPVWSPHSPWSTAHKELCPLVRGPLTSPRTPTALHRCPEQRRMQARGLRPTARPGGTYRELQLPQTCSFKAQRPGGLARERHAHVAVNPLRPHAPP